MLMLSAGAMAPTRVSTLHAASLDGLTPSSSGRSKNRKPFG